MQYNYILLNEGFYRWLETNYLPVQSQILFLKLVHLFNLSGWSEWLTVDNHRMMSLVQTEREESVIKWRDKLLENNLLLYVKGKKGTPNRYKLNDELEFINEAKNTGVESGGYCGVKSGVQNGVKNGVKSGVIYKQNKTKQNKDIPLTTFEGYRAREGNADNGCIPETANNKRSGCAKRAKRPKQSYGEFGNVLLNAEDLDKLKAKLGTEASGYIERLSGYMASTGKRYKDHYATILNWSRKDASSESQLKGAEPGTHTPPADTKEDHPKLNKFGRPWCTEFPE